MSLEPKCKSKSNISVASSSLSSTLHNQEVLRCVCVVGLSPLRGGHMGRAPERINNGRFFFVVLNVKIKIMTQISWSKNIYSCWLIFKMSFINPLKDTIFRVCFIKDFFEYFLSSTYVLSMVKICNYGFHNLSPVCVVGLSPLRGEHRDRAPENINNWD